MKKLKRNCTVLFIIFLSLKIFGQAERKTHNDSLRNKYSFRTDLTLISGYQIHKNHFAEIGIGIKRDGIVGHHPSTIIYGITNEIKLYNGFIWGLKAGLWVGNGYNLGLNIINYTDFKESALRFRPEIGFGFGKFRVVYGYNLALTNKEFRGINTHNFGLNIMFDLKKLNKEK